MTKTKPRAKRMLTWTAQEPAGPRRWWFFLLVAYFAPPIAVVLYAYGNWSTALFVAVLGVLLFVVYMPRPKVWSYELSGPSLTATRERRRGPADERKIDLRNYHSIDARLVRRSGRGGAGLRVLTLWPRGRFALDVDIYLPADAGKVESALSEQILETK